MATGILRPMVGANRRRLRHTSLSIAVSLLILPLPKGGDSSYASKQSGTYRVIGMSLIVFSRIVPGMQRSVSSPTLTVSLE